ncbi:MAG: class I SAM-dependent methyltransferase [Saprospiraceae bacterium]|nr:class I SAM-dependent methyltransferase [Saprospiraceae bacterium]
MGEIGAGEGLTSMMFAVIFDNLDLYVNEISKEKLAYAEISFQKCRSILPHNAYHAVLGSAVSTGLEGKDLDRIIILHSYHHFSKANKMLASIRQSLAPGGQVIVVEPDASLRKQASSMCRLAMKKETILKIWEKNGFQLLDEWKDETTVYLKFAVGGPNPKP